MISQISQNLALPAKCARGKKRRKLVEKKSVSFPEGVNSLQGVAAAYQGRDWWREAAHSKG